MPKLIKILVMCGLYSGLVVGALMIIAAVALQPAIGLAVAGYVMCRVMWLSLDDPR